MHVSKWSTRDTRSNKSVTRWPHSAIHVNASVLINSNLSTHHESISGECGWPSSRTLPFLTLVALMQTCSILVSKLDLP